MIIVVSGKPMAGREPARGSIGPPATKALVKGLSGGPDDARSRSRRSLLTGSSRQCPPSALNTRVEAGPLHHAGDAMRASAWNKTDLQRFLAKSTTLSGTEYIVVGLITTKGDADFQTTPATPRTPHRIPKKNSAGCPEGAGEAAEGLEESSRRGAKMASGGRGRPAAQPFAEWHVNP
ncbi:hypothetical protein [Streptosporangium fragile]|uniref:hypothetical protein n=1 Tax=Streptosporangium fragile TaxID=46186 RepID=UPI0031EC5B22